MQIPRVKFQHQYEYNTKPRPSWFLKIDLKPKCYNFSTLMSTISKQKYPSLHHLHKKEENRKLECLPSNKKKRLRSRKELGKSVCIHVYLKYSKGKGQRMRLSPYSLSQDPLWNEHNQIIPIIFKKSSKSGPVRMEDQNQLHHTQCITWVSKH